MHKIDFFQKHQKKKKKIIPTPNFCIFQETIFWLQTSWQTAAIKSNPEVFLNTLSNTHISCILIHMN